VSVGEISLEEIHVLTYNNFRVFGRIEDKIKSTCFITEDPTSTADVKGRVDAKVKQCMGLLKLYCELSLGRQMLLAQLSSLARNKKLWVLSESLLNLVAESQKLDQKVLKFLTKPLENPAARYTIYKLYTHQEDNPVVVAYIKKLDKKEDFDVLLEKEVQIEVEFDKQHILLCSKVYLQGACRLFREGSPLVEGFPKNWGAYTKSLFIPPGLLVNGKINPSLFETLTMTAKEPVRLGPLIGLGVFSDEKLTKVKDLRVNKYLAGKNRNMVIICKGSEDDWCQKVEDMTGEQELDQLGGRDFTQPSSILIPDGFEVILIGDNNVLGPVYGHQVLKSSKTSKICGGAKWKYIIARRVDPEKKSSAQKVVACEEKNFGGFCIQMGSEFLSGTDFKPVSITDVPATYSKTPKAKGCGIPKVQSVKIPAAFHLYLFDDSKETRLSGPFSGPLEMADLAVEGITLNKALIIPSATLGQRSDIEEGINAMEKSIIDESAQNDAPVNKTAPASDVVLPAKRHQLHRHHHRNLNKVVQ